MQAFVQYGLWKDAANQAVRISDGQFNSDSGTYVSSLLQLYAENSTPTARFARYRWIWLKVPTIHS